MKQAEIAGARSSDNVFSGRLVNIDYAPDGNYADLTFEATQIVTDLTPRKTGPALGQLHTERPGTPGEHDQESD